MTSKKAAESKAQEKANKLIAKFKKHGIELKVHLLNESTCQLMAGKYFKVGWYWKGISNLYLVQYSDTGSETIITGKPRKEIVECMANIINNERNNTKG